MACDCTSCLCNEGVFAHKVEKIICTDKTSTVLYFETTDTAGGPYNITWGDLRTNCPGVGSSTPATTWATWAVNYKGTLNLATSFCTLHGIPTALDPKHPTTLALGAALPAGSNGRDLFAREYDVKVLGARINYRYLDAPKIHHALNIFDRSQVSSWTGELKPDGHLSFELREEFARAMILPDHPFADLQSLRDKPIRVRWVTALLETKQGQRIDVALHDERMVRSCSLEHLEPGAEGRIVLTQAAWSEWNLPT